MRNPKITLLGFNTGATGAGHVLGELQTSLMELLWREPRLTVNEVEERVKRRRDIAHTTVQTTLDRMHRKGYLKRDKRGKAFVYTPRYTRDEFEQGMAQEVLRPLLKQFTETAMSTFVELLGTDEAALQRLEIMLRKKRLEQKNSAKE